MCVLKLVVFFIFSSSISYLRRILPGLVLIYPPEERYRVRHLRDAAPLRDVDAQHLVGAVLGDVVEVDEHLRPLGGVESLRDVVVERLQVRARHPRLRRRWRRGWEVRTRRGGVLAEQTEQAEKEGGRFFTLVVIATPTTSCKTESGDEKAIICDKGTRDRSDKKNTS